MAALTRTVLPCRSHRCELGLIYNPLAHTGVRDLSGAGAHGPGRGGSRGPWCSRRRHRTWPCRRPRKWWSRHGGVDIDHQPAVPRPGAKRPRPAQALGDDSVQLADVAETEGPQGSPKRGGGHDPVPEHPAARPERSRSAWRMWLAPATMACTSVRALCPGRKPPARSMKRTMGVHQRLQAQAGCQRRHQDQAGVGHQTRFVEGHLHTVEAVRYWLH